MPLLPFPTTGEAASTLSQHEAILLVMRKKKGDDDDDDTNPPHHHPSVPLVEDSDNEGMTQTPMRFHTHGGTTSNAKDFVATTYSHECNNTGGEEHLHPQ